MSFTLIFLAILMSVVVWWLIKQTINVQPWASHPATSNVRDDGVHSPLTTLPMATMKVGLGVFLAVITSLFALFISAYSIRMDYPDWRPLSEPALLWANTGVLVLSSVFLQWAWNASKRGDIAAIRMGLTGGAACALGFVIGQGVAWQQLAAAGYVVTGNPANGFFYVLTGLHALHIFGGLIALRKSVARVWRAEDSAALRLGVELCAVYWHYLLAIWLVLLTLMVST